ncbi:DUF1508 domain-containing protein [Arthrobacter sp. ISL-72]|uniref:YegP family protein n=1 Tax=Arthrobacter sp. ISL-72 TaxID=2819114 RepID=UPI001BE815C8|nr:DUF1508 domain-containing protein [Arthrobacter sp. ISL-72]MBT2596967.1 DUF1508 domain-containing protein [Arthrobacter sp. ISL-72]
MAGKFELFVDAEAQYRFRLTTSDGTELAISSAFRDKSAAVAGIEAVRECAGMGLITDLALASTPVPVSAPAAVPAVPVAVPPVCESRPTTADTLRTHAAARRATVLHWSGAV